MRMAQDETLRLWGQSIKGLREILNPEGMPRTGDDPAMSQKALGEKLDPPVGQSTVARWESGLMEPRRHYKAQLARALHTDVRVLFPMTRSAA